MLFSVNQSDLVSDILNQLSGAAPDRKIMRRLNRQGRREAKRSVPVDGIRKMIIASVDEAMALTANRYLTERESAQVRLDSAEGEHLQLQRQIQQLSSGGSSVNPTTGSQTPANDLSGPLALLVDQRRSRALSTAQDALRTLDVEKNAAVQRLPALRDEYRQKCETCIAAGTLLWQRYCVGYLWADNGPGTTSPDLDDDDLAISIAVPTIFEGQTVSGVTSVDPHPPAGSPPMPTVDAALSGFEEPAGVTDLGSIGAAATFAMQQEAEQ